MSGRWQFLTTCVDVPPADVPKLMDLIAAERSIAYRTFRAALGPAELDEWASGMKYDTGRERGGLRLADDWAIGFYRSTWDGKPALVIHHSAIEHVWVRT